MHLYFTNKNEEFEIEDFPVYNSFRQQSLYSHVGTLLSLTFYYVCYYRVQAH